MRENVIHDESASALAQSVWDALRIMGFDTDGDPTPAALTTQGYAQLGRILIEEATDIRACYDEALDATPNEPRPDVDADTFTLGLALDEAQERASRDPLLAVWKQRLNPWAEGI